MSTINIVHLSDLHFRDSTNPSADNTLVALSEDIESIKPSIIIVTGDCVDNDIASLKRVYSKKSSAYSIVQEYLEGLCRKCQLDPNQRLFICPGNHDLKIKGLIPLPYARTIFSKTLGKYTRSKNIGELFTSIGSFNSASIHLRNLATGYVNEKEISTVITGLNNGGTDQREEINDSLRIAILHHHTMPITDTRSGMTEKETNLLLHNAGFLMRKLAHGRFNIILHGHRHAPGFCKATYLINNCEHELAVIAAGSANPLGMFRSYNVIHYDKDVGVDLSVRAEDTNHTFSEQTKIREIVNAQHFQERITNRAVSMVSQIENRDGLENVFSDETSIRVQVEENGDATWQIFHTNVRNKGKEPITRIQFTLTLDKYSSVASIIATRRSDKQRIDCTIAPTKDRKVIYALTFNPGIVDDPISFEVSYKIINAFYFSRTELQESDEPARIKDYIGHLVRFQTGKLSNSISFPRFYNLFDPRISVSTFRPMGDSRFEHYSLNQFETLKYARSLSCYTNPYQLTSIIHNPTLNTAYDIEWTLPIQDPRETPPATDHAKKLKNLKKRLSSSQGQSVSIIIQKHLKAFKESLFNQTAPRLINDFEIRFCSLNEKATHLHTLFLDPCCSQTQRHCEHPASKGTYALGEKIVGLAAKRREMIASSYDDDNDGLFCKMHSSFCEHCSQPCYQHILSLPLSFPYKSDNIIGVITFLSCDSDSSLAQVVTPLASPPAPLSSRLNDTSTLPNVCQAFIEHTLAAFEVLFQELVKNY